MSPKRYFRRVVFVHVLLVMFGASLVLLLIRAKTGFLPSVVWVTALTLLLSVTSAAWLNRLFSLPLWTMARIVRQWAEGEVSSRPATIGTPATVELAESLNEMRDRVAEQIAMIDRQRHTFESLLSQLSEGVLVADAEGRIVLVNPRAISLLDLRSPRPDRSFVGLAVEECVAQHHIQKLLHPNVFHGELDKGSSSDIETESWGDLNAPRSETKLGIITDAGQITLLIRATDVSLPDWRTGQESGSSEFEQRAGRLLVLTDVTQLALALQVRTDFAANASHELRTPLATLRAVIETLSTLNPGEDSTAISQFLDTMRRHVERMESIVTNLLTLARIESKSARFETEAFSFPELVQDIKKSLAEPIAAKRHAFIADLAESCQQVRSNRDLLELVLRNLVENAVRFTDDGGRIAIKAHADPQDTVIEVVDNGCGISQEEQARVFERFYQVERARSGAKRGCGLGLSIVRHAVNALGGMVSLESEVGRGTRVTVRLPRTIISQTQPIHSQ